MIRLGDINFNLGADQTRLVQATNAVVKFGAKVEAAAKKQTASSFRAANALKRQEAAALSALQQTLNLNSQIRKIGNHPRLIDKNTKGFYDLSQAMTVGERSSLSFQRAQVAFKANLEGVKRGLKEAGGSFRDAGNDLKNFNNTIRNATSAAILVSGPLSVIGARIQALGAIATRSGIAITAFIAGLAGAAFVLGKTAQASVKTAIELDKVNARLLAVTGTQRASNEAFEDLISLADRTGSELNILANSWSKLQIAAKGGKLSTQDVGKIFEDLVFGASKFRLNNDELRGTLRAFEQMLSKGTVQAEELRGQLGDRLPGALNVAATAMGVTTKELNKMLVAGELFAEDFLPKFSKEFRKAVGADQIKKIESLQASIGRLSTAGILFTKNFDEAIGISRAFQIVLNNIAGAINLVAGQLHKLPALLAAVGVGMTIAFAPLLIRGIVAIAAAVKALTASIVALNIAVLANPLGALASTVARIAIAIGAAVATFIGVTTVTNKTAKSTEQLNQELRETIKHYERLGKLPAQNEFDQVSEQYAEAVDEIDKLQNKLRSLRYQQDIANNSIGFIGFSPNLGIDAAIAKEEKRLSIVSELARELKKIVDGRAEAVRLAEEEKVKAYNLSIAAASKQIIRLEAMNIATIAGAGAVDALTASFERQDAILSFGEELKKAGLSLEGINQLIRQYIGALEEADVITRKKIFTDLERQLDDIVNKTKVVSEGGTKALKEFEEALSMKSARENTLEEIKNRMIAAGIAFDVATKQVQKFREAFEWLEYEIARANRHETVESILKEIKFLDEETAAYRAGAEAVKEFNKHVKVRQELEKDKASLASVGVYDPDLLRIKEAALLANLAAKDIKEPTSSKGSVTRRDPRSKGLDDLNVLIAFNERLIKTLSETSTGFRKVRQDLQFSKALDSEKARLERFNLTAEETASTLEDFKTAQETLGKTALKAEDLNEALSSVIQTTKKLSKDIAIQGAINPADFAISPEAAQSLVQLRVNLEKMEVSQEVVNEQLRERRDLLTVYDEEARRLDRIAQAYAAINDTNQSTATSARIAGNVNFDDIWTGSGYAMQIAEYRTNLEVAGKAQEVVNEQTKEFAIQLRNVIELQKRFSQYDSAIRRIEGAFESASDSMVDMALEGELTLSSLGDVAKSVVKVIISEFLKLAVIQPIVGSIVGAFGFTSGGTAGRKGLAFGGNGIEKVKFMRKGGVLTKRTGFLSGSGPIIGGEAGKEAIVPLVRTSTGDLGVRTTGGRTSNGDFVYVDNRTFDARGADPAAISRLQRAIEEDRALFTFKVSQFMRRKRQGITA